MFNDKEKDKMLKAAKEKNDSLFIMYKGSSIILTADFSSKTLKNTSCWNENI